MPFPLFHLPVAALGQALRAMSFQELIPLMIMSKRSARLVAQHSFGNLPHYMDVRRFESDNSISFNFQRNGGTPTVFSVNAGEFTIQPVGVILREWNWNGTTVLTKTVDKSLTIYCHDNISEVRQRLLELIFDSSHGEWSDVSFEYARWLTAGNLLSLTNCSKITLRNMIIDDRGVNEFLRKWKRGCRLNEFRMSRIERPYFVFFTLMRGIDHGWYTSPGYLFRRRYDFIEEGEYARIPMDATRSAVFFIMNKKEIQLTVKDAIPLEEGEVAIVRGTRPWFRCHFNQFMRCHRLKNSVFFLILFFMINFFRHIPMIYPAQNPMPIIEQAYAIFPFHRRR